MDKEDKITNKNILDSRKEPKFESERVSQALFNTPCEVLNNWRRRSTADA